MQIIGDEKKNSGGIKDYVKKEMTANEVDSIIKTLEGDKYIELTSDRGIYKTTTLGDDFKGYVNQQAAIVSENARLDKLESDQRASQKSIEQLTFWIAVGTISAAVIALLLLVLQWYFDLHPVAPK